MATMTMATGSDDVVEDAKTMRAAIQEGMGSADVLTIKEVPLPEVPDDRVLLKVRGSSVNAADYHTIRGGRVVSLIGMLMRMPDAPPIRGGDVSGIVAAVGKDVTALHPGDEVFGTARGSWAQYATATERTLVAKPAALSFLAAGTVGVAAVTALQGLRDKGRLAAGQRVLIYGAGGGVGTYAVQIAKALGAHVTAVTGPASFELVRPLGADVLVDYTKEDVAKRGERYDVIFDVAAIRSIGSLRRMLVPGGILVLAGAAKKGGSIGLFARLIAGMFRGRVLKQRVIFYVASIRSEDLAFLKGLLESGAIHPVIDRTYPLSDIREAVRYTIDGHGRAKVAIAVD
ncbi:MAG TPA: NAD(P)-dependent alcohol dehydrogenase [Candidatus Limnocylindria bacterium]